MMSFAQELLTTLESTGQATTENVLSVILAKCRRHASAEAGSIFIVRSSPDGDSFLEACSLQNDRVRMYSDMFKLQINPESIAGYVASTGDILEIDDLYSLPEGAPYSFNRSFDEQDGYRSRSMLAFPLKTVDGQIVGVIQLLNHIDSLSADGTPHYSTFPLDMVDEMQGITKIVGIIVERMALLDEIKLLKGA